MTDQKVSKAELIRRYLSSNPKEETAAVVSALTDHGVTTGQVYNVRREGKTKTKKPATKATKKLGKSERAIKKPDANLSDGKSGRGKSRPYPQRTLEEALVVPEAIRLKNNGRPMETEQVAKASMNISKGNNRFFYTAAAARDYFLQLEADKARAKLCGPVSEDIRVVGAAKGKFDRTAFVIMPFSEKGDNPRPTGFFETVLECIIVPAGNSAGFALETARQKGSDVIHTTIINALLDADLVIADLTDHNPNVLCELGIRLANEKPVALIRAKGTERIFDVDILRIEDYDSRIWPNTVGDDITRIADHIKATWDNRDSMRPYMEILTGRSQSK